MRCYYYDSMTAYKGLICVYFLLHLRDKLEMKAIKDGSASYASLERKAKLYDKLVRGELSDGEDEEKYCVDFFRKGQEQEDSDQLQQHDISNTEPRDEDGDDDASLLSDTKAAGLGRQAGTFDRSEHKRFVMYVLLIIHYFEL